MAEIRGRLFAWGAGIWSSDDGVTWTAAEISKGSIYGVAELGGRLYAWGNAGYRQTGTQRMYHPGIWVSDDGANWRATEVPQAEEYTLVEDVVDMGDRLVAVAVGGLPGAGWRMTSTTIYTSTDGEAWQPVDQTPGRDAGAHGILLQVGDRLLAVGDNDVWASTDGGLSWEVSTTADELDGWMITAAQVDDLIVGAGAEVHIQPAYGLSGSPVRIEKSERRRSSIFSNRSIQGDGYDEPALGDYEGPALVWTSSDGTTWTRRELAQGDYINYATAIGPNGQIVVLAASQTPLIVWASNDHGETWNEIRPETSAQLSWGFVTAMPGGYAATGAAYNEGRKNIQGVVWTSSDGITWTEQYVDIVAAGIFWTPTFGLVTTGFDWDPAERAEYGYVALGPDPLP